MQNICRLSTFLQVVERYKSDGFEFLWNAFNDANYLEEITGLQELYADPLAAEVILNLNKCR